MFILTATDVIENAKKIFLSEKFISAFDVVRGSFGDDIDDELILDLLKGKIGYRDNDGSVDFGEELIDEEYKEEIEYVLSSYDNVLSIKDEHYVVKNSLEFSFTNFTGKNDFIDYINENLRVLISADEFKYVKEMKAYSVDLFEDASYIYYDDKNIYFFEKYEKANIQFITQIKDDASDVIKLFESRGF